MGEGLGAHGRAEGGALRPRLPSVRVTTRARPGAAGGGPGGLSFSGRSLDTLGAGQGGSNGRTRFPLREGDTSSSEEHGWEASGLLLVNKYPRCNSA